MYKSATALVLASAALVAQAAPSITAPIASTNWTCGKPQQVKWGDNGADPNIKSMGMIEIDLYTGSQKVQDWLATLNTVNASAGVSKVQIPCDVGPSGQYYFLRVHEAIASANRSDDTWSAIFSLTSATGKFNSTVSSAIAAGQSSSTSASSSASKTTGGLTATNNPTSTSSPDSGASVTRVSGALLIGAAVLGAFFL